MSSVAASQLLSILRKRGVEVQAGHGPWKLRGLNYDPQNGKVRISKTGKTTTLRGSPETIADLLVELSKSC
jgi:hypothetical protein